MLLEHEHIDPPARQHEPEHRPRGTAADHAACGVLNVSENPCLGSSGLPGNPPGFERHHSLLSHPRGLIAFTYRSTISSMRPVAGLRGGPPATNRPSRTAYVSKGPMNMRAAASPSTSSPITPRSRVRSMKRAKLLMARSGTVARKSPASCGNL